MRLLPILTMACLTATQAGASWFIRGDPDGSGRRNIADVISIIGHLFRADQTTLRCLAAADVNDDGKVEITDAIDLLQYLFLGSPPPWPEPLFPGCIHEQTTGGLGCEESGACSPRGVIFVLDKSGSMSDAGRYQKLQREVIGAIEGLSSVDQLALIFFDANLLQYPRSNAPVNAWVQAKYAAIMWVLSTQTGHGTCMKPALLSALDLAEKSNTPLKEIIFITDGAYILCPGHSSDEETYANEILAEVTVRNTNGVVIDVIKVGDSVNDAWLRELAARNGGSYAVIP